MENIENSTNTKDKATAGIISLLLMLLLFLILYFLKLSYLYPPPESREIIEIELTSWGGGGGGGGNSNPVNHPVATAPAAEHLQTMPDIDLPAVPSSPRKTPEKNNIAEPAREDSPKPNPAAMYQPGMGGGKGGGSGSGTGSGTGSGLGDGEGSGSGGGKGAGTGMGIGYGTGDRGISYMPDLHVKESGKVYVEVHVAASGKILDAKILSNTKYPTSITTAKIQQECVNKAKTAVYKPGKEELRVIVFKN
ncbi:MAG: hypothetical protein LBR51_02410 [Bacteroidales bacterium]|jgi:hypothetical protein|nr:hypothetical protein [Bacteroidales bacterium]